jgi:hypothetical protein
MADKFDEDIAKLVRDTVAGLSPEQAIEYRRSKAASDAEDRQRALNREAAAKRQAARVEAARVEAEHEFGQAIRDRFFKANAHATQTDFARLWPKLRDAAMLEAGDASAESREVERQHPRYNF